VREAVMIKFAIDRRSLFKATGALVVSVGIPGGAGYCEAVEVRFAADSPLEGAGFEPSVPRLG
jgi:hypothetical protein